MLKSKAGRQPDGLNGINYYGYKNNIFIMLTIVLSAVMP
jgi:hypothetical protein